MPSSDHYNFSSCPICGCKKISLMAYKNGYPLFRCPHCSHVFCDIDNNQFSQASPSDYLSSFTHGLMNSDADYYNHLKSGELPGRPSHVVAEKITEFIKHSHYGPGSKLLDVGCGSGHLMLQAEKLGLYTTGIEPGGWGKIAAKERELKIKTGFLEPNTSSKLYDIITATDVLEHVPKPIIFMKMLTTYLETSGILIISIPYASSIEFMLKKEKWDMVEPPTHNQFFTKKSLQYLSHSVGLSLSHQFRFNVKNLKGFSRYKVARIFFDIIVPGSQIICVFKKTV